MYTGLQHLHSSLAWVVLALIVYVIGASVYAMIRKSPFTPMHRKFALFGLISTHLQWMIGFILYFVSPLGWQLLSGEAMGDSIARLYTVEHPVVMLLGVTLITIGFSRAKRLEDDSKKHLNITGFYAAGLILILSRIPWHTWP